MLPHTPVQPAAASSRQARLQALQERLLPLVKQAALDLAAELLDLPEEQLLGQVEFALRDRVHRLAADVHQTELDARKKGATKVPAASANAAARTPSSKTTSNATS